MATSIGREGMATRRREPHGVSFGGASGESADDYYTFVPSDEELSDDERVDASMTAARAPGPDTDADRIADALAATQISAAAERAILRPMGEQAEHRAFRRATLTDGVFARRGAEDVRVSREEMERHAARKAELLSALDACTQRSEPRGAGHWCGDAPFRFRPAAAAQGDVEMASASPAPTVATEGVAPQQSTRGKKIPSPFAGGGSDGDSDSDEDQEAENARGEPDPLYDDAMDDADAKWVERNFGARPEESASGGSLCCPCCFVTVCMSCERHVKYNNQYRANSAINCRLNKDEVLKYLRSGSSGSLPFQARASHVSTKASAGSAAARLLQADEYYPVACSDCGTTVGVYDHAQQFHFFNVLPSS